MKALKKLYLHNFREFLNQDDQLIYDFITNNDKKNEALSRLLASPDEKNKNHKDEKIINEIENTKFEKERNECLALARKEFYLLKKIDRIDLKKKLIFKILDNLKNHHNKHDKGVVYDTSNLVYVENYRGEKALNEAKKLLSREIKKLPSQLEEFFSHDEGYKSIINSSSNHFDKLKDYLRRIRENTEMQITHLDPKTFSLKNVFISKLVEKSEGNLVNYYLVSGIRKIIIGIKIFNAKMALLKVNPKPKKSIFFIFGGMEKRYLPLINELTAIVSKKYNVKFTHIDNFLHYADLGPIDIYFMVCIGSSSKYYPPYYYIPTAHDTAKFMKRNIKEENIHKVFLFGVCGSFTDKRNATYLPNEFSSLFYSFEERTHLEDLQNIQKTKIRINNLLDKTIIGKKARIFTCSTLFNSSIVAISKEEYKQAKIQIEKNKKIPNNKKKSTLIKKIKELKTERILTYSKYITQNNIADGVEMESYIFAKNFPGKLGVYLEVSDNVMKAESISFDMRKFHSNIKKDFPKILKVGFS